MNTSFLPDARYNNVLIVEEQSVAALRMERQLLNSGYKVVSICTNAEEAIEKMGLLQPDLVLMDIHLRGRIDGIETARTIYERWQIPVVFLISFTHSTIFKHAYEAFAYGCLVKPFKSNELHTTLSTALARGKADRELQAIEARRRLALEAGGLAEWEYTDGRLLSSARPATLFGVSPSFLKEDWDQFLTRVHLQDRPALESAVRDSLSQRRLLHLQFRGLLSDGAIRWFEAHAKVHGPAVRAWGLPSHHATEKLRNNCCKPRIRLYIRPKRQARAGCAFMKAK